MHSRLCQVKHPWCDQIGRKLVSLAEENLNWKLHFLYSEILQNTRKALKLKTITVLKYVAILHVVANNYRLCIVFFCYSSWTKTLRQVFEKINRTGIISVEFTQLSLGHMFKYSNFRILKLKFHDVTNASAWNMEYILLDSLGNSTVWQWKLINFYKRKMLSVKFCKNFFPGNSNLGHNILEHYNVLMQIWLTTSKRKRDI